MYAQKSFKMLKLPVSTAPDVTTLLTCFTMNKIKLLFPLCNFETAVLLKMFLNDLKTLNSPNSKVSTKENIWAIVTKYTL